MVAGQCAVESRSRGRCTNTAEKAVDEKSRDVGHDQRWKTRCWSEIRILKQAGLDGVEMNTPGGPPNQEIKEACGLRPGILVEGMVDSVHWQQTLSDPESRSSEPKGLGAPQQSPPGL